MLRLFTLFVVFNISKTKYAIVKLNQVCTLTAVFCV